ncbi:tetratricopeptide repeat protein [Reichenbachiella sp.]|uniref:tetratricopeptide repeat protein n=1 Tax=Reichenbachiella sp. TaxID=2184521 RepID=UPI003B5CCE42
MKLPNLLNKGLYIVFTIISFIDLSPVLAQSLNTLEELQLSGFKPSFNYENLDDNPVDEVTGPEDIKGYFLRAVEKLKHGEPESAKVDLDYVISHNPDFGGVYYYRALSFKALAKIDSAIMDLEKALSTKSLEYFVPSHVELGFIQINHYRNYDGAREHFDLANKLNPNNAQVNYALGYLYLQTSDYANAVKFTKRSIKLDRSNNRSYYQLAECRLKEGLLGLAREAIDNLLEIYPTDEYALIFKSALYPYKGQVKKRISVLEELLGQNPDNSYALFMVGMLYLEEGRGVEGFKSMAKAIEKSLLNLSDTQNNFITSHKYRQIPAVLFVASEIDGYSEEMEKMAIDLFLNSGTRFLGPPNFKSYNKLWYSKNPVPTGLYLLHSIVAENNNDLKYWRTDNLKILQRDTTNYDVYRSLGNYYSRVKEYIKAEKNYTKMLNLDRNIASGYKIRGANRLKSGQYKKAVQDFNIYLSLDNKYSVKVLEERARCYLQMGYFELAEEDFNKVIELSPKIIQGDAYLNLAAIKLHQGDTLAAITVFDEVIDRILERRAITNDKLPLYQAFNLRGNLEFQRNQYAKAIVDFNRVLEFDPNFYLAYFNRGVAYFNAGKFENAEADFNFWLTVQKEDVNGFYWRGWTRYKLNNIDGARADLKKAADLGSIDAKKLLNELIENPSASSNK